MSKFQHIGIIIKPRDERLREVLASLLPFLQNKGLQLFFDESVQINGFDEKPILSRTALAEQSEAIIVIGGDGTLLHAARTVVEYNVPLIGVNIGRLGFLVDVSPDEINTQLNAMLDGHYYLEERTLLQGSVHRQSKVLTESLALNDVVLHIRDAVRMIEFETRINGKLVHLQRADGIVVSTPTGSTAYSLSGGGPILHPDLDATVLVPICPHTLSNRPIVVSGDSKIEIQLMPHSRTRAQVAFDGQANFNVEPEDIITIERHPQKLNLIHPETYDYYHILRKKLRWSEQP